MSTDIRKALVSERRKRYLESLIKEALTSALLEQGQPSAAPPAPAPAPPAPAPDAAATPPPPPGADVASGQQPFTVDDMIERLNVIRGGRSFTDPEVYGRLVTYFKTLEDGAKESLETFLVELGKIVIDVGSEGAGQKAADPSAPLAPPAPAAAPPPAPAPATSAGAAPPIAPT